MGSRIFSTLKKKRFVCIFPLLLALAWALSARAPTAECPHWFRTTPSNPLPEK
jgi:hypothetical protein